MASNDLAPTADGVRVAVRVRPLNERERGLISACVGGSGNVSWALNDKSMTQMVEQRPVLSNSFAFDHVFLQDVNNETVYKSLAAPVVLSSVEGINGVIFAYGQTAAGKTHTMLGNEHDPGITRRSISDLFSAISMARGRGFLLRASYIEIYNEVIMDLLAAGGESLKIHEDVVNKRVYVNAKEEVVTSVQDVMDMLSAGEQARAVGVTNMNERSSRSHTIFTLRIESRELHFTDANEPLDDDEDEGVAVRASTLTLVDLAGSERVAFTKAEGMRLKEGGHINKSLLTLGTVINKLSSGESRSAAHIPYRDSKLTRILQPALGGNARTAIVCAVTPSLVHMDETLSTLRFASRAKKVTNHAHANEFLDDRAKLRRAEKEIARLKAENSAIRKMSSVPEGSNISASSATQTEAGQAQLEKRAQKRMKVFLQKFETLVSMSRNDSAAPEVRPSTSSVQSARDSAGSVRTSNNWRTLPEVSDAWICRPMLRDALDLSGLPAKNMRSGAGAGLSTMSSDDSEEGDADLRIRALRAEHELAKVRSEIECERKAMESEVAMLVDATDSAQRAQSNSQVELEDAMSLLAHAQVTSLVDEIFEGAVMISERDNKIRVAEKEIKRIRGVETELMDVSAKLAVSEKSLGEALKREKRGVGPVMKEKAAFQSKLTDAEGKLRGLRHNLSKVTSEKSTLEREVKGVERQNKMLAAEVEKHRKHKGMADARVAKQHEDEKRKLESEMEAIKEAEKAVLQSKLADLEEKLRDLHQNISTITSEKSTLAMEMEGVERQNRILAAEVEKHREDKVIENARVAKEHENEKKKLESKMQAIKEAEKTVLQSKLMDVEGQLRDLHQNLSKITSEKSTLEMEMEGVERQNKMLASEVEQNREDKIIEDARVAKEHEEEKKKLESEIQAVKENNTATKGIIAAQKSKIEDLSMRGVEDRENFEQRTSELESIVKELAERNEALLSEQQAAGNENIQLSENLQRASDHSHELEQSVRKMQSENGLALKDAHENFERRASELSSSLKKLVDRNEALLREQQAAANEKIRLMESLQRASERSHGLEERLRKMKSADGLVGKLEKRVRRREESIAKLEAVLREAEGVNMSAGRGENWASAKHVVELEAETRSIQVEVERLESSLKKLNVEKGTLIEEAHLLRQKIKEREAIWTRSLRDRRATDMLQLRRECQACGDKSSFVVRV